MSLTLRTTLGCTEAVIDGGGSLQRFYQIAGILTDQLNAAVVNKEDDFDNINWNFRLQNYNLTLQYSIYSGITLFPTKTSAAKRRENEAVAELAGVLEGKLMTVDMQGRAS